MNRDSSRSHAIFIVTVINSMELTRPRFAQLYLVDLAGSENIERTNVVGQQLKEAQMINKSLLALGQVIESLSSGLRKHVPYRNSKLTRILQNCLGGNARTSLIVMASLHEVNAEESLNSLRFGSSASMVRNQANANIMSAAELKVQLQRSREDLAQLQDRYRQLEQENACLRERRWTVDLATARPPSEVFAWNAGASTRSVAWSQRTLGKSFFESCCRHCSAPSRVV